uniref:Uncharacterized protein n=1 Tax=Megaviridae environmental sample TaxID=1737588 RepID=A0A5J6VKS4_9VIRU|nr:MAG: hypothetical protein [Megaviridae environmental sample]
MIIKCLNIILLICCFYLILYYKYSIENYDTSSNKILGFQICGIGNGHLTQAEIIYNVLIKNYKIPVVIIYGMEDNFSNIFSESTVIYKKMYSSRESTGNMNKFNMALDLFKLVKIKNYEKEYNITTWVNFWITNLFNMRTKQIILANQFSISDIRINIITSMMKKLSYTDIISIHLPSKLTNYVVPPLINLNKIKRKEIKDNLILAYSVSGENFTEFIFILAKNNPLYKFKYFTYNTINIYPENIELFKPDKLNFQKYLKNCAAVLCTSGNELILECVYNNIPVATMPCSLKQFEQVHNYKKFVENLKYALPMTKYLDINLLKNRNTTKFSLDLIDSLKNRDCKIKQLFKNLIV